MIKIEQKNFSTAEFGPMIWGPGVVSSPERWRVVRLSRWVLREFIERSRTTIHRNTRERRLTLSGVVYQEESVAGAFWGWNDTWQVVGPGVGDVSVYPVFEISNFFLGGERKKKHI